MSKRNSFSSLSLFLFASALTATGAVYGQSNSCGANALPSPLPLDSQAMANTCMPDANPVCSSASFPYRTSNTRLILTEPSAISLTVAGDPLFSPTPYVSGEGCNDGDCGTTLPAGEYCLTVTADPSSAMGSCGCFNLLIETASDQVFENGFD